MKSANETWIREIFSKIQKAWNENDYKSLINIESKYLYERESERIKKYISENKREYIKIIKNNFIEIYENKDDKNNECIKANIGVAIKNYVYDVNSGEVTDGIKDCVIERIYKMTMRKRSEEEEIQAICEGCGAKIDLYYSNFCGYCGTMLKNNKFDWVVEEIESFDIK